MMYYSDYNRQENGLAPAEFDLQPPAAPPEAPKKKSRMGLKVTALLLACALLGGGAGVGGALLTQKAVERTADTTTLFQGGRTPTVVNLSKIKAGQPLSAAEVYASNVNSVVGITTQITTNVWGQQVAQAASGSGFVISSDGYILTNYHVIEDATSVSVIFKNGDEYPATIVGGEEDNDVAVLKIDAAGLIPVVMGNSDDLVVGEEVVAIGNPLGEMTFSETRGIVSALDKPLTMSDGTVLNVLQTDCAINSGNSGGPLFNMYGQVIGITNAKYSRSSNSNEASIEGICFAIPIDDVKDMIQDIITHGYVTGKPYVGVTLATVNAQAAARYGRPGGAYVQSIVPGAAAEKAGLKVGDIITAVDGETVDGSAAFIAIKDKHRAGDTVTLSIDREARSMTLTLTFDERTPDDQVGQVPAEDDSGSGSYNYGGQWGYLPFGW